MPSAHKLSRLIAASVLLLVAGALAWGVGLPERADFTGTYISGIGRVAPEVGWFAPPFTLTLLDGTSLTLPTAKQRFILNFWATWCAPCEVELPILQALHYEGLAYVVAINMGEPRPHVERWLAERQLTLPVVIDTDLALTRAYAVRGQPSSYIVQPDGRISRVIFGAADELTLRASLQP